VGARAFALECLNVDFAPDTFGALYADTYDARNDPGTTAESVALISELAGAGRILELAIGTGRMALPLVARGHDLTGVEASQAMVELMRAKPGGAAIPVVIGDMADVPVEGQFDHIFLVFNTIFNLTTQATQVRLFANVARHLAPGGTFLVECFVPDFSAFTENQRMKVRGLEMDSLFFEAVDHDPIAQRLHFQRVRMTGGGFTLSPLVMRYIWPAEMDLMAALAGLTLRHRWGDWRRGTFAAGSRMHVSLYEASR
jgi:SAM-dependent methyltransferase